MDGRVIENLKHNIQPRRFAAALILPPVITLLLSVPLIVISPIFTLVAATAVLIGGLPYLIVGGAALYLWLRAGHRKPLSAALLGLCVNITVCTVGSALVILTVGASDAVILLAFLGISSIFALIWCGGFALLYNRFIRRSFSRP